MFERLAVRRQCRCCGRGRRHRQLGQRLVRTAGNRHFRADDVHRRFAAAFAPRSFGERTQLCGACGDHRVAQGARIIRAAHRTVEVNLAKAGAHVLGHHRAGLGQRDCSVLALPGVGTQVIAAENQLGAWQRGPLGETENEIAKRCRAHARITAVLIDLVGGGLDHGELAGVGSEPQRSFEHRRVCRAHRVHADRLAGLVSRHDVEQRLHETADTR